MNPYLPFAALPVAVTAAWFAASNWTSSEPGRYRVPSVTQLEEPAVPGTTGLADAIESDIRVDVFLPREPARPPAPEPTLILHSVMTGNHMHLATINGQLVKQGDKVAGYLVTGIAADGVELTRGSKTRRLPMRPLHELAQKTATTSGLAQNSASVRQKPDDPAQDLTATLYSQPPQL